MLQKITSLILSIILLNTVVYAEPHFFDITSDNLSNVLEQANNMTHNNAFGFVETIANDATVLTPFEVLELHEDNSNTLDILENLFNSKVEDTLDDFTSATIELNDSVSSQENFEQINPATELLEDVQDDLMNELNNNTTDLGNENDEILIGVVVNELTEEDDSDGDGLKGSNDSSSSTDNSDPDGDGPDEDDAPPEPEIPPEDPGVTEEISHLFFDFFSTEVFADNTSNTENTNISQNKYYLKTKNNSYIINSDDERTMYFIKLISNKNIEIEVLATKKSNVKISIKYISVLEEIDDIIWEKYDSFCLDKLAEEYPTGVFFTKEENYFFTDHNTNKIYQVKTDDYLLQILIPLISNKGIKVTIDGQYISDTVIYVSEITLQEDLPEDISTEYKKQYKEFLKTTLFNFTGSIKNIDNEICLVTNDGTFKLTSKEQNILNIVFNFVNNNKTVKVHGYLDPDTHIIDIQQIDY